eukprot:11067750-Karenia_brevis.AAC.1
MAWAQPMGQMDLTMQMLGQMPPLQLTAAQQEMLQRTEKVALQLTNKENEADEPQVLPPTRDATRNAHMLQQAAFEEM